jgi:hypothetical protein
MFSSRFPWFRNLLASSARPRARWTPSLEALEDRWLPSAITHVQDIDRTGSIGGFKASDLFLSVTSPVAVGHDIVVTVATGDINSQDAVSVTDSAGNSYTLDVDVANGSGGRALVFSAVGVRPLPKGSEIDVHFNVPIPLEAAAASEFAELDAANPVDLALSRTGNDAAPNNDLRVNNILLPRIFAHELVVGAIGAFKGSVANPPTFTAAAGNTLLPDAISDDGNKPDDFVTLNREFLIAESPQAVFDATDGAFSTAVSWADGLVAFNADTATHFHVSPAAGAVPAGKPVSVTVTALDDNGHAAAGYTGTVHFFSSAGMAGLPADYTFTAADHGSHTFSLMLGSRGPQSIQVADVLDPTLKVSGMVAVTPFDATALVTVTRVQVVQLPNGDLQRKLTLRNTGADAPPGPVWLVFDHLGRHTRLRHRAGVTAGLAPLGSPFAEIIPPGGVWNPGETLTKLVTFANPHGGCLRYVPRVLVGPGMP